MLSVPLPRMSPRSATNAARPIFWSERLPMSMRSALTVRLPVPKIGASGKPAFETAGSLKGNVSSRGCGGARKGWPMTR